MADDEKILRIEAEVKGDEPVTAGGQRRDEEAKVNETLDREDHDRLQHDSQQRDILRDLVNAILHGEDEPLPPTPQAGGGGGLLLPPPPGGGGGSGPPALPPPTNPPNYGAYGG